MSFTGGYEPSYMPVIRRDQHCEIEELMKWHGSPECFSAIEALSISRDVLNLTRDPYGCVFRHFFRTCES